MWSWLTSALVALYRRLLRAYPRRFQADFASEMEAVFAQALADAAQRGRGTALAFAARELAHAPALLVREHWRAERAPHPEAGMSKSIKLVIYFLLPLLLALASLAIGFLLRGGIVSFAMLGAIAAGWLLVPVLVWAARRFRTRVWLVAGLLVLGGLALPAELSYYTGDRPAGDLPGLLAWHPWLMPPLALLVAGLLFSAGVRAAAPGPSGAGRTIAALCLGLCALLLARTLHFLYWLLVWDSTYDALFIFWMVLPALAALAAGGVAVAVLPHRWPWAAAYAVLGPLLLIGVYTLAQRVDFRQLTDQRAARVTQALTAYHAREGRYPATLQQLRPWYLLTVPGPVIIHGQDWCYQAGDSYYQLGYVNREHWSDPRLVGLLYSAEGIAPAGAELCGAEIAALQQRYPGYYGVQRE
jgi:hypothetical protein